MLRAVAVVGAEQIGAIPSSEKGQPNGVATLDGDGKLTEAEVPNSLSVPGGVSVANTTDAASPTNSGILLSAAPDDADLLFFDAGRAVNNRTVEWIFFQGKLQARFKNDAGSAVVVPLAFAGGHASGITGIESNSGSGSWAHAGAFSATGPASVLPTGGNGVVVTGTNSSGVPTIAATGAAADISLEINPKGSAGLSLGGPLTLPGGASSYKGVSTAGNGIASVYAKDDRATQGANIGATTIFAVPANKGGLYRVSCYAVVTRAGTTSSTLPNIGILWTDDTSNTALEASNVSPTNTANAVGAFGQGAQIVSARAETNIQFQTSNYASSGATSMQYATHIIVEYLG